MKNLLWQVFCLLLNGSLDELALKAWTFIKSQQIAFLSDKTLICWLFVYEIMI